jgi:hypothetical protein
MKYLKKYTEFINETIVNKKIVYHASPYIFSSFKETNTFFSENIKFATEYSESKSIEQGIDYDTNLYICELNGNIFNINIKEDYDKLENILPEKTRMYEDKEEFLLNLKGFQTNHIYEPILNIKIGETFPNPEYKSEKYIVLDRDENYVYYITENTFNDYIEKGLKRNYDKYFSILSSSNWLSDIFKDMNDYVYNYVTEYINNNKNNYPYVNDYERMNVINLLLTKDDLFKDKYEQMLSDNTKKVIQHIKNSDYLRKMNIKEEVVELKNTWTLYENMVVETAIEELGYDGYVAKEKNINTYNIFYPNKCIKIKQYEFPKGNTFDNFQDYKEYKKFYNEHPKDKHEWEIYKQYKNK